LRLCALGGQPEVALFGERRIHRGERDLEHFAGCLALEVPRVEGARDARAEADRVREAEGRVVAERQLRDVPVRVAAQIVVAMPVDRTGELLERRFLLEQPPSVVSGRVAAVQPHLCAR